LYHKGDYDGIKADMKGFSNFFYYLMLN